MLDSSVGGKTAVDFCGVKNAVGTVYPAETTLVDFSLLDFLPRSLADEGRGELFKYAYLDENISRLIDENADLKVLVESCLKYKQRIVSIDESDLLLRRKLNLGHTLGHAFETAFRLPHGQAVANGLFYETQIACFLKICSPDFWKKKRAVLQQNFEIIKEFDEEQIVALCQSDKKNISRKISLMLPDGRFGVRETFLNAEELNGLLKRCYLNRETTISILV